MGNPSTQNSILVTNPAILLAKDESKDHIINYLKVFLNTLPANENAIEITPNGLEKAVDVLTPCSRLIGYGTFAGYLCTVVAKQIKDSAALSTANVILSQVNTLIFGSLYGLSAIQNSYQLAKDHNFSNQLKKEDDQVLQDLIRGLCRPISCNLDDLKASWSALTPQMQDSKKQQFKQKLQKTALEKLEKDNVNIKQITENFQTPVKEIEFLLGLRDQEYWQLTPLEAIGLVITQQTIKKRNWVELKERTNTQVAEAVDKAYRRGLVERINSDNPAVKTIAKSQMKRLVGRVRIESSQTKRIHKALLIINLLGSIMSLIGLITLPLGIGIAITAISCLITMSSIGIKLYLSKKELADSACGEHEKTLIIILAVLLGISLATFTGITLAFGLPLLQLGVVLGVGGLLGGGILGYQYHLLNQKERLWKEAHPSSEVFQKLLSEKKGWDKEVHNVFKKLPRDLRQAVRRKYEAENNPDFRLLTLGNKISILKKTAKHFWQKWLISGLEEDRKLALEVQGVHDSLLLFKKQTRKHANLDINNNAPTKEESALTNILQNAEISQQWQKDCRYIFHRKNSLKTLSKEVQTASQKLLISL